MNSAKGRPTRAFIKKGKISTESCTPTYFLVESKRYIQIIKHGSFIIDIVRVLDSYLEI
jgi:hypothetical protein